MSKVRTAREIAECWDVFTDEWDGSINTVVKIMERLTGAEVTMFHCVEGCWGTVWVSPRVVFSFLVDMTKRTIRAWDDQEIWVGEVTGDYPVEPQTWVEGKFCVERPSGDIRKVPFRFNKTELLIDGRHYDTQDPWAELKNYHAGL